MSFSVRVRERDCRPLIPEAARWCEWYTDHMKKLPSLLPHLQQLQQQQQLQHKANAGRYLILPSSLVLRASLSSCLWISVLLQSLTTSALVVLGYKYAVSLRQLQLERRKGLWPRLLRKVKERCGVLNFEFVQGH